MATKGSGFGIGDEVSLRGTVRLIDAAGEGTVTVEIAATGQRITVELVAKGKPSQAFSKAPRGRQGKFFAEREK